MRRVRDMLSALLAVNHTPRVYWAEVVGDDAHR